MLVCWHRKIGIELGRIGLCSLSLGEEAAEQFFFEDAQILTGCGLGQELFDLINKLRIGTESFGTYFIPVVACLSDEFSLLRIAAKIIVALWTEGRSVVFGVGSAFTLWNDVMDVHAKFLADAA